MGGVIPNKEAALTPGLLFLTSFEPGTSYNMSNPRGFSGLSDRLGWRNQVNVIDFLKTEVKQLQAWQSAAGGVFNGLRRGVPGGANVPLPLALVELLASQITGLPVGTWADINEVVAAIEAIPGGKQIIHIITQIPGDLLDPEGTLTTWATNLKGFLTGVNLNDVALDIPEAIINWVTTYVIPLVRDFTSEFIRYAVGLGGSIFPWHFPMSFGEATNDLADVGRAIAAAPQHAQRVTDTIIQQITGTQATGHSLQDLKTAIQQLPGRFVVGTLPPEVIPLLTTDVIPQEIRGGISTLQGYFTNLFQTAGGLAIDDLTNFLNGLAPIKSIIAALNGTGEGLIGLVDALRHIHAGNLVEVTVENTIDWLTAGEQTIADQIHTAVGLGAGQELTAIGAALKQLPFINLIGQPGAVGSGPVQETVDHFVEAFTNQPSPGSTLAALGNRFGTFFTHMIGDPALPPPLTSVAGLNTANAETLAKMATTRPPSHAIVPTGDATFDHSQLSGAALPIIPVTQNVSAIGLIATPFGANPNTPPNTWPLKKGAVWESTGFTGAIDGLFINIYSYNIIDNSLNLINTSPNLVAMISGEGAVTNYYEYNFAPDVDYLPPGAFNYIPYSQVDLFAVELQIVGTGTYNLVGLQHMSAPYPGARPPKSWAQRTGSPVPAAPEFIPSPDFSSTYLPWFSLVGDQGVTTYVPQPAAFTDAGDFSYDIPAWATQVDYAICPDGGGAAGGVDTWGGGGGAGNWVFGTLEVGSPTGPPATTADFTSTITGTIGPGGLGGSSGYHRVDNTIFHTHTIDLDLAVVGTDGSGTTMSWDSPDGPQQIVVPGGAGGVINSGNPIGASPGNEIFNGNRFFGGAEQAGETLESGAAPAYVGYGGNKPGGGGSGSYSGSGLTGETVHLGTVQAFFYGVDDYQTAGSGAPGAVFLIASAQPATPATTFPYIPLQQQIPVSIPRSALR